MTPHLRQIKARILVEVRTTPASTRRTARLQTWSVLQASFVVAGALFFACDGVRHGQGRPPWLSALGACAWAAVAAASLGATLGQGKASLGRDRTVLLAIAIGAPAVLLATMIALAAAYPEAALVHPERLGLKCLGLTLVAGAPPLLGLTMVRRGAAARNAVTTGAALGSACGAAAGVMVQQWCPVMTARHLAVGHIAPIAFLALVGAVLGARVLAMRALRSRGPVVLSER
jgi:hypothetical protein